MTIRANARGKADLVMLFTKTRAELVKRLDTLGRMVYPAGAIWVCWPKKASKVASDMTGDVVRAVALPKGLVDVKVCAIDQTWSGLKVVWRKELREPASDFGRCSSGDARRSGRGWGRRWRLPTRPCRRG